MTDMIFVSSKISDGNMDYNLGDSKEVLKSRKKFLSSYRINLSSIIALKQPHDNIVTKVGKLQKGMGAFRYEDAVYGDGLITNEKEIYLMVKTADCIAIGFHDSKHHAIGLAHVGWKGLEKGIINNVVNALKENFGTNPKDLLIQISPSIGPCHYRMDLWSEVENQLQSLGVLKENIDNPKLCTYESKDYFSHRRAADQNLPDYRFVTILGL